MQNKIVTKIAKIGTVSVGHDDHILRERDETYPSTMPEWLTIIAYIL